MYRIHGVERHYAWGSRDAIPSLMGRPPAVAPVAELWFGAHPTAPALVDSSAATTDLLHLIATDPEVILGEDVAARFHWRLPFLLKLIAPAHPLSLQVHPDRERAQAMFAREEEDGVPIDSPRRNYKDPNHKPELVYAISEFEAVCGFRAPRRAAELLADLGTPLTDRLHDMLRAEPDAVGVKRAFTSLLNLVTRPGPDAVAAVATACARRLERGSPSVRTDRNVVLLQDEYPGDPGVVASLLLNPVTLRPGEALFVPAGGVHAYISGLAVEVMASSDNVLRAGLTHKHIDVPEMLACIDYVAAPPLRLAAEHFGGPVGVFYAPVDDFELAIAHVNAGTGAYELRGKGPRIILAIEGVVTVRSGSGCAELTPGEAVFIRADDERPTVSGNGVLVQTDVP